MLCSTNVGRGSRNVERVGCATIDTASAEKKLLSREQLGVDPVRRLAWSNWMRGHDERQQHDRRDQRAARPCRPTMRQSRCRTAAMPTITPYASPPNTTK